MTIDPIRTIAAIFPEDLPMWRAAEGMLRRHLPDRRVAVSFDLDRGAGVLDDAEVVLAFALREDAAAAAPRLRWIQALGSGTDALDAAARTRGAMLTSARGLHAAPLSEAVLAAMLALSRGMADQIRDQDAARWRPRPARLLARARIGIVGTGEIAAAVARKCAACDMDVVGFSAAPRDLSGFDRVVDRGALIDEAPGLDHIVLLTPLDPSTRHIASGPLFAAMKPSAFLLNFGRGGLVDEPALVAALAGGSIGGAALDTFATEPLPADHPLWHIPGALLTPHAAGRHVGYVADVIGLFVDNLAIFETGAVEHMRNRVM